MVRSRSAVRLCQWAPLKISSATAHLTMRGRRLMVNHGTPNPRLGVRFPPPLPRSFVTWELSLEIFLRAYQKGVAHVWQKTSSSWKKSTCQFHSSSSRISWSICSNSSGSYTTRIVKKRGYVVYPKEKLLKSIASHTTRFFKSFTKNQLLGNYCIKKDDPYYQTYKYLHHNWRIALNLPNNTILGQKQKYLLQFRLVMKLKCKKAQ